MAHVKDPRAAWNGLVYHEDRKAVLANAGADPADEDKGWDDLSLLARSKLTVFLTGRLWPASEPPPARMAFPEEELG